MGLWQRMGKVREDMAKILVVDDEKLIVKGIRFSLEQDGMEVDCAYDGEENAVTGSRRLNCYPCTQKAY